MPATSSSIRAGRAFVELFADDSRLVRGLRRAEKRLVNFGKSVTGLGTRIAGITAAAFAPIGIAAIKAASDAEETLSRFEQVFGEQSDAASAFADQLAKDVGRSKFAIRDALSTFQSFFVGLGFAPGSARELSETLQTLAIDFASFNNLSDDEAVQRFISALSGSGEVLDKFGVNIKQAALEQELLRQGVNKAWSEVTEQEKAVARLSIIMRSMNDQGAVGDAVRTSGSFAIQMKRLRGQLHDTAVVLGQALLPIVTPLVAKLAKLTTLAAGWIGRNRQLIATVFKIAAGVTLLGGVLIGLGFLITGVGVAFGALATIVTTTGSLIGLVGAAILAVVSPVGLVIAAVVALGTTILWASGAGGKALQWLSDKFRGLRDRAAASFRGITDALMAGDITLAARILWLSLRAEWTRGSNFLNQVWAGVKTYFLSAWTDAVYGTLAAAQIVWNALSVAWIETIAFLGDAWDGFVAIFKQTWEDLKATALKAWAQIKGAFDEDLDVEAEIRAIDNRRQEAITGIEDDTARKLAEREAARQRQRERQQREHEDALTAISQAAQEEEREHERQAAEDSERAEEELRRTREELDNAIEEARRKREQQDQENLDGPQVDAPPPPELDLAALQYQLSGLDNQLQRAITVRGTFNATPGSLQGLAVNGQDAVKRTAKATEETARNTRRIERNLEQGAAFG